MPLRACALLGMLPLVTAQGAGAAGQQVLGTAVLGGMISATLFNNLFVPPFYVILQGFGEWLGRSKRTGAAPAEGGGSPSIGRNDGPVTEPGT